MGASNSSKYGNFILQDETKLLNLPSKTDEAVKEVENALDLNENIDDAYISAAVESKSEYSDSIIPYISGFIHRKLLKKESCLSCHSYLENCTIRTSSQFLDFIDRGYLTKPNSNINLVVKVTNSCLNQEKQRKNILQEKNLVQTISLKVLRILNSRYPKIFSQLDSHVDPSNLFKLESHKSLMIKKVISCYLSIRLKHFCKEYNENVLDKKFKRVVYKAVHFQGQ